METLLAIAIGVVFAASVYLFLSRDLLRILIGFILLGAATNLLLLLSGRLGPIKPALVDVGATTLAADAANPLPQALILTAIVIGFGLAAFGLMLALQAWRRFGTLDPDEMRDAERIDAASLDAASLDAASLDAAGSSNAADEAAPVRRAATGARA